MMGNEAKALWRRQLSFSLAAVADLQRQWICDGGSGGGFRATAAWRLQAVQRRQR
jgi:hypothetical protein